VIVYYVVDQTQLLPITGADPKGSEVDASEVADEL